MARGEGVKLILEGVAEGWRIAGEIAAANVPVLVTPIENTPASFEALGATLANARRLADAGVLVAIEGNGHHRERELRYNAGNAVANGLDRSEEHTSELKTQMRTSYAVFSLKKKNNRQSN